jgi:hypothetical protein
MVDAQTLTTMFGGIGVGVAAIYYVMMIRNNEKQRKRDFVFQKLQAPLQFYEAYGTLLYTRDWKTYEEFREKYYWKTDLMPKLWFVLNHFNALGLLIKEGLATPEQIFQQYLPLSIINIYEKYRPEIVVARYTVSMEVHNPDAWGGLELLYGEAKRLYPKSPKPGLTREVLLEHARKMDELLASGAPLP